MNKLLLAERMHWTLDYVDSLDLVKYWALLARLDGIDKARAYRQDRGR